MKTTWKVTLISGSVVIALVVGVAGYRYFKPQSKADSDSMEVMTMGDDDAMPGMDMGSMPGMDMGESTPEAANVPGYKEIQLDPRKQQLIGVKTAIVNQQTLTRSIRAYGTTSHDTDLYAAQEEFLSAYRYYRSLAGNDGQTTAKLLLDSARKKLQIMGYGETQLNRLIARGQSDDSLIDGANTSRSWIYAQINQKDLPYVKAGQRARITGSEFAGQTVYGTVDSLDTVIDPETRSIRARILTDATKTIAHQSYVNIDIEVPIGTVVALPEEAVIDSGGRQIAFVSIGDGYFQPRELVLGRRAAGFYEVIAGVKVGEKVVSAANFFIDSESQLKAASGNMMSH